jgi:hypothetical protein
VFCARALVGFLCILFVYLEAYCAFLIIQFYLLIKKKIGKGFGLDTVVNVD